VQEEWPVIARSVPDIDAIIDRLRGLGDDDGSVGIQIPVILAVGGRIPEARESVRSYGRLYADADFEAFAADFESWLDAGAVGPQPRADAFPAPKALFRTEMELTWAESASSAAFVAYAGLRRLFGRRSE
jgi:hypothetical protein